MRSLFRSRMRPAYRAALSNTLSIDFCVPAVRAERMCPAVRLSVAAAVVRAEDGKDGGPAAIARRAHLPFRLTADRRVPSSQAHTKTERGSSMPTFQTPASTTSRILRSPARLQSM
jgi:hypothetical protein